MRKSWLFFSLLVGPLLLVLLLQSLTSGRQAAPLYAENGDPVSHLPLILAAEATATPTATATATPTATITPTVTATPTEEPSPEPPLLVNGSFEACDDHDPNKCNWPTLPNGNQPPYTGWELFQIPMGDPIFGADYTATEVSEAKHLEWPHNIPPEEYIGKPEAIILHGKNTYKIFSGSEAFGTELKQTVSLAPGSNWRLTAPINVHLHEETDAWAAESSVSVNGLPGNSWSNGFNMIDRRFCKHTVMFTVPNDGQAHISIKVKSKYRNAKDFFIDDISLVPASDPAPHETMPECERNSLLSGPRRAKVDDQYRDSWMDY